MNYRHIYHAGNFADVFKHIVLMRVVAYLKQKDKPFFALDTHAGIGLYNLTSEQALKTMEASAGIGSLLDYDGEMPDAVADYIALVKSFNFGGPIERYPGSPVILQDMLRDGDRMVANELHPEDVHTLRDALGRDARVRVEHRDAYECLKALLPPDERRGLVLVDPPFEVRNEFELMVRGLQDAHKRWATGIYAFWYPIKNPADIRKYHDAVRGLHIPKCTAYDFYLRDTDDLDVFNGCGMLMVNAPWTLEDDIRAITPVLTRAMTGGEGRIDITHLSGE